MFKTRAKRTMGFYLVVLIFIMLYAFIIPVPVLAESGTISIERSNTPSDYHFNNFASGGSITWTQIHFDSASYNQINDFSIKTYGGYVMTFVNDFETTTFTITNGGIGTGVSYYDRNSSKVYWVFSGSNTYSSSPLTLSYTKKHKKSIVSQDSPQARLRIRCLSV